MKMFVFHCLFVCLYMLLFHFITTGSLALAVLKLTAVRWAHPSDCQGYRLGLHHQQLVWIWIGMVILLTSINMFLFVAWELALERTGGILLVKSEWTQVAWLFMLPESMNHNVHGMLLIGWILNTVFCLWKSEIFCSCCCFFSLFLRFLYI